MADLLTAVSPSTIERALADMRNGRRVFVLTVTKEGARGLLEQARALLVTGERASRAAGSQRINRAGGGWIIFATIATAGAHSRGYNVDSVYVDHTELRTALAPAMCCSSDPTFVCS